MHAHTHTHQRAQRRQHVAPTLKAFINRFAHTSCSSRFRDDHAPRPSDGSNGRSRASRTCGPANSCAERAHPKTHHRTHTSRAAGEQLCDAQQRKQQLQLRTRTSGRRFEASSNVKRCASRACFEPWARRILANRVSTSCAISTAHSMAISAMQQTRQTHTGTATPMHTQHTTADHSRPQHTTARHSTPQHATAQHSALSTPLSSALRRLCRVLPASATRFLPRGFDTLASEGRPQHQQRQPLATTLVALALPSPHPLPQHRLVRARVWVRVGPWLSRWVSPLHGVWFETPSRLAVCSLGAGPHATPNEARRLSPAGVEEGETQSSPQQDKSPSRVNAVCAASVQTTMPSAVCSLCAQTLAQGAVIAGGSNSWGQ